MKEEERTLAVSDRTVGAGVMVCFLLLRAQHPKKSPG